MRDELKKELCKELCVDEIVAGRFPVTLTNQLTPENCHFFLFSFPEMRQIEGEMIDPVEVISLLRKGVKVLGVEKPSDMTPTRKFEYAKPCVYLPNAGKRVLYLAGHDPEEFKNFYLS